MAPLAYLPVQLAQIELGEGLLGLVILVADVVAVVSLIAGRGSFTHKVLWTVLIVLLPVIGLVLYLLLGRSKADA